jgi:hypothetical protein
MSREKRAALCSVDSKETALRLLGDTADDKYPIFMAGDQPWSMILCSILSGANFQQELNLFFSDQYCTFQVRRCTLCALSWLI